MVRKDSADVDVRFALVFPDVYEVGMSYMGYPILYHILNQTDGVYAERAFAPWRDMEEQMRRENVPLFTLETFSALTDFDVVGFTFQYELHYTTILNLLDLAGIPLEAHLRNENHPIVMGGGPSAFNPEPMAEFIDVFLVGDGEEAIVEVADTIREAKQNHLSRHQTLCKLAAIPGIYVPAFYRAEYDQDGRFAGLQLTEETAPRRIRARIVCELNESFYPKNPLVPIVQTTHDRVSLEIARGCSRGCRFCNAGMLYRPVRQRSPKELLKQAVANIEATGYEEISLVSLSTSDYTELGELMQALHKSFSHQHVSVSFPSLRPESFTPEVAAFAKGVRKSGLTLAPEAGTQRLRDVINKATSAEELLRAVDLAYGEGWNLVKLYFMIGQPTETEEDLLGIVDLVEQVKKVAARYRGKRLNLSVSPFIPKAGTPFQWAPQDLMDRTQQKIEFLRERLHGRNVKLSWRRPNVAMAEGVLARGDRRIAAVIKRAWELGANLEGWSEHFDFARYQQAMQENDIHFESILQGFEREQTLPWDHIDKGVTTTFLWDEYQRALGEEKLPDCRFGACNACGLMGQPVCKDLIARQKQDVPAPQPEQKNVEFDVTPITTPKVSCTDATLYARIHYHQGEALRYLSHLDKLRMFERVFRRAHVPIVFTEGYNPHPKMTFGPSLATGHVSDAEYLDVKIYQTNPPLDLIKAIAPQLPQGIDIIAVRYMEQKPKALAALINRAEYQIDLLEPPTRPVLRQRIQNLLQEPTLMVERHSKKKLKNIDVRPFIETIDVRDQSVMLRTIIKDGRTIRTDELLSLLFSENGGAPPVRIRRTAMWVESGSERLDPLDI